MKYNDRYDLEETKEGFILIWDTQEDRYLNEGNPLSRVLDVPNEIKCWEENLDEAAWYRSQQDGYTKGEFQEQQARNQRLK